MNRIVTYLLAGVAATSFAAQAQKPVENEALSFFRLNNLSSFASEKLTTVDGPVRLPFHNDGKPTGREVGITNPQGTHYPVSWKGHTYAVLQEVKFSGYCGEMVKSDDGRTVYFHNIMPDFQTYWLKGEIDVERNVVVFENDQLIYSDGLNNYYFVGMQCELDDYGYATPPTPEQVAVCADKVEIPMTPDGGIDATGFFFWLWGYSYLNVDRDGNQISQDTYMSYSYSMVGEVLSNPVTTAPDDIEERQFFFSQQDVQYGFDYPDTKAYMGAVKRNGDDIYLRGICSLSPLSYVKGFVDGNSVTMPSEQVLTDGRFFYTISGIGNLREEEVEYNGYTWMDIVYDRENQIEFNIEDGNFIMPKGKGVMSDFYGSDSRWPYWYVDLELNEYEGNRPATPYAVEQLNYTTHWEYGFCDFNFFHTSQDALTGEWINPRNCFYEVYFDDKPYTFTSAKHTLMDGDTEITQVPVLYKSVDFKPYDEFSMWQSEYMYFTMHDENMPWSRMKMRIGYIDDEGVTHYSAFTGTRNRDALVDDVAVNVADFRITNENALVIAGTPLGFSMSANCTSGFFYGPLYVEIRDEEGNLVDVIESLPIDLKNGDTISEIEVSDYFNKGVDGLRYSASVWTFVDCDYLKVCPNEIEFGVSGNTGVSSLANPSCTEYYDMQGVKILGLPASPGVYIAITPAANGSRIVKKVVVK